MGVFFFCRSYGLRSYGLRSHGLCSYGLYSWHGVPFLLPKPSLVVLYFPAGVENLPSWAPSAAERLAYIVMAYIIMADIVMAYVGVAYTGMAFKVMA